MFSEDFGLRIDNCEIHRTGISQFEIPNSQFPIVSRWKFSSYEPMEVLREFVPEAEDHRHEELDR